MYNRLVPPLQKCRFVIARHLAALSLLASGVACAGSDGRDAGAPAADAGPTSDAGSTVDAGSTCAAPLTACGGACVDLETSAAHCGGCSRACEAGQVCRQSACGAPLAGFTTPVAEYAIDDGGRNCTTGTGRNKKLALLPDGRVALAVLCDGEVFVTTSGDQGQSFGALVSLGMTGASDAYLLGDASGVLHVAAALDSGVLVYSRATDGGATWSPARPVDLGPVASWGPPSGPAFLVHEGQVFLTSVDNPPTEARLWRSDEGGTTSFVRLATLPNRDSPDLFAAEGALWFVTSGDLGEFSDVVMRSDDGGASFTEARRVDVRTLALARQAFGGDVYYTATGLDGHVGRYALAEDDAATFARDPALQSAFNSGMSLGAEGTVFVDISDGDLFEDAREEFVVRIPAGATAAEPPQFLVDGEPLSTTAIRLPNTALLAAPDGQGVMAAYARGGDVYVQVKVY